MKILSIFYLLLSFTTAFSQNESKKVLIHYMGWYGEGSMGRHWTDGHAHSPLIGLYDSRKWPAITYHTLLSWACGIDGLVINVKDDYDKSCMRNVVQTIKRIHKIDTANFDYCFSISYDDQGMSDISSAKENFTYLKNNILTDSVDFLRYDSIPAIFIFNYPDEYLTAKDYDSALYEVFGSEKPKLIWNQFETTAIGLVNSFYPWVGPSSAGWDKVNGLEWGHNYLTWFYPAVNAYKNSLDFLVGGVWPGFDDRPIPPPWGDNRWMERLDGDVYDGTWSILNNYSGALPIQYTVIETWNDWNEGTEIEPSVETGYQYLKLTEKNINTFNGKSISDDTVKFEAARQIYIVSKLLEKNDSDSLLNYPSLETAIAYFLQKRFDESYSLALQITASVTGISTPEDLNNSSIDVFPNPVNKTSQITINTKRDENISIKLYDLTGRQVSTLYTGHLMNGNRTIPFDASDFKRGVYFIVLSSENIQITKKIILR
jgi:hypothetical protein